MNFVMPTVEPVLTGQNGTPEEMMKVIEQGYRICYRSEKNMKQGSEELIHRLLHGTDKSQKIHSSPLEHRRIIVDACDWVVDAITNWQGERATSFINVIPSNYESPSTDCEFLLEGNFRAFFDFVNEYKPNNDTIRRSYFRFDEARLVLNNELHRYFPLIFDYFEPWNDEDNAIDWEGVHYVGEASNYMTFRITTSRDMLQEIARHRSLSPNVESTRYCNYSKRGMSICIPRPYEWSEQFIHLEDDKVYEQAVDSIPPIESATSMYDLLFSMSLYSEKAYNKAISLGATPQEARGLLLGSTKTEILLTGTYSAWAHFLDLRNDIAADPQMRYLAEKIEAWFVNIGVHDIRDYKF